LPISIGGQTKEENKSRPIFVNLYSALQTMIGLLEGTASFISGKRRLLKAEGEWRGSAFPVITNPLVGSDWGITSATVNEGREGER